MMSVSSHIAEIKRLAGVAETENIKLDGGCKSSAPKVRAALLDIAKLCSEGRKVALDIGKSIPTKSRTLKEEKDEKHPDGKSSDSDDLPLEQPILGRQDGPQSVTPLQAPKPAKEPAKRGRRPKVAATSAVVPIP